MAEKVKGQESQPKVDPPIAVKVKSVAGNGTKLENGKNDQPGE